MVAHTHMSPLHEDKLMRLLAITAAGAVVIIAAAQEINVEYQQALDQYSLEVAYSMLPYTQL